MYDFYARDSVVALLRGWGMKYGETKDMSYRKIMFMYVCFVCVCVCVCVCVGVGPTTMRECIRNSLFQTVIKTKHLKRQFQPCSVKWGCHFSLKPKPKFLYCSSNTKLKNV